MRILVLTPTFLPALGGAELVLLHVFRRLAKRHSILVLTPYLSEKLLGASGSHEYDHLINFDVRRFHDRFSMIKIRGHRLTHGLIPPFSLSAVAAIYDAVRSFTPDVINVHYVMPTGLAGLFAQRVLKIPVVITYNGRDVPGPGIPKLWKYWHRLIGLNCADMTFVSKYCRDVIYGTTSSIGQVIYNGVEDSVPVSTKQILDLRSKLNLLPDERVLLALQRLDYLKRVDIIIRSMLEVLKHSSKTRLIIVGKGADLPRLKAVTSELGISDYVIFTGYLSDSEIPVYHALADLFVFHSTYETFGIVLAEAMNYGKVIVSVNNTAIREVVDDGKTGFLVPTFDYRALAAAILKLLADPTRREEMGKRGEEKVRNTFRWDTIAVKYETVLESLISKGAADQ